MLIFSFVLDAFCARAETISVLHSFRDNEGRYPVAGLAISDSTLYRTTRGGVASDLGTVFSLGIDGSAFQTLHSFTGNGGGPYGDVTLSGSKLFGTTAAGGIYTSGSIFTLNSDGSGFQTLKSFTGDSDGGTPLAGLTLVGATLYGTTSGGGNNNRGTVFSINTDGSGFRVLPA